MQNEKTVNHNHKNNEFTGLRESLNYASYGTVKPIVSRHIQNISRTSVTAKGFVLYVGIDEEQANLQGTSIKNIAHDLQSYLRTIAPQAQSKINIALMNKKSETKPSYSSPHADIWSSSKSKVIIDLSRKKVIIEQENIQLTFKEFELLQYLVLREGITVPREDLINEIWPNEKNDSLGSRAIDVHIRRLRAKLGEYPDIVRTVRGQGYRFDRHADVSILLENSPSPDII